MPTHTEPRGRIGIYERHGEPGTDHEVWRHRVGGPPFSGPDLLALADVAQRDRLMQVKGMNGNGYALCCGPESGADYTCLMVTAEAAELDREQLARDLAVMFARASHLDYDVIVFNEGLGRFSSAP